MITSSKELVNELRNYKLLQQKIKAQTELLKIIDYELYGKVSSPLRYEDCLIIKNGQMLTEKILIPHGSFNKSAIDDYRERVYLEQDRINRIIEDCKFRIKDVNDALSLFAKEDQILLELRFIEDTKYEQLPRRLEQIDSKLCYTADGARTKIKRRLNQFDKIMNDPIRFKEIAERFLKVNGTEH